MKAIFALLFFYSLCGSSLAAQPNILHILADDMGWTALSFYGNKDVTTPNLDRLASQGMRFTSAYADVQCGDYLDTTGFTPDDKPYGKLVIGPRTELYNMREGIRETHDLAIEAR